MYILINNNNNKMNNIIYLENFILALQNLENPKLPGAWFLTHALIHILE